MDKYTNIIFSCLSVRMLSKQFTHIINTTLENQTVDLRGKQKALFVKSQQQMEFKWMSITLVKRENTLLTAGQYEGLL